MIGTILAKRYRIVERIGGGGMALVFRARDLQVGRDVAIKVLRGQFASDEEFIRRFRREAQNAASLSHPNIVQILDVGYDADQYFIVMELVEGQTLKELIQAQGPLPIAEATRIAMEILDALAHAHANRIVHRDIKPHNILIARDGRVKVTDFGIARATTTDTVTHTGSIMGSAHYFSPEQANGQPTGEKSDIYSTGVVLYEMITGTLPFQGDSPITVALKHIRERVVPASQLNAEVPVELDNIILKAMEKDAEDRYPSSDEMREALAQFQSDHAAGLTHMPSGDFPTMDLRGMNKGQFRADDEDEAEDDKPSRAWLWTALIAAIVVGLLATGAWSVYKFLEVPIVKVPDVVGMSHLEAQTALQHAKLAPTVAGYQHSATVPEQHVIKQSEPPGTDKKQGSDIALTISQGPDLKPLTDVRGRDIDEARSMLASDRFVVGEVTPRHASQAEGTVLEMTPPALTPLAPDSVVTLVVSSGPLRVPEIVGLTLAQAQKKLQAAGLSMGAPDYVADATRPKDTVLSSNPPQGTPVVANTVVKLTVSQGPAASGTPFEKQVIVPGVSGTWHDLRVELVDTVAGTPTNTLLINEKRQVGEKVMVRGSFYGTAYLRVLVDGNEAQRISLP